uniref:Transmembrane protein 231 n=1 Tax=Pyramimonas obovata TaxID=1411642 RepID=A0A7S0WWC3_9CHLO|mmetsp:Transcript_7157/g.14518  ORF Transcript_7157/g.14518 Transcript_7157/m.14518 type:complete len:316 (+) Transcript_7157:330-1277(+)|eukprot:CAMPEP_0118936646 /NCGR_PEP_ID=MMETSP1169-20130426/19796_1 /TAXON_ID=36882 /ORGANISM="Pyramimonas obovata, Strain CCMP722" /LENGTH=315 /DNA_ID=CAMNT_0006879969 /DNA_START=262 /DNA_END=1209 /DNA_ORIENTATION=+
MVQVYEEPYAKRHYAGRFTPAYCFPCCSSLIFIIVAFVIALSTGQLWIKSHTFLHQPDVKFTYEMLVVMETNVPGQEKVWSTVDRINTLYHEKVAAVDVQATEQDINYDGKTDIIDVLVTSRGVTPVHSVKLLMGFDYSVEGEADLDMRTLAYLTHSSALPGSALYVDGDLRLKQREPLTAGSSNNAYEGVQGSPFADFVQSADGTSGIATLGLNGIFNRYLFRNETTYYDYSYPVWKAGSGDVFEVRARVRVPSHENIVFRPAPLTIAKFGWVQVFAIIYPLLWLLRKAEWVIFHYRVLQTRVVSDITPKMHKF